MLNSKSLSNIIKDVLSGLKDPALKIGVPPIEYENFANISRVREMMLIYGAEAAMKAMGYSDGTRMEKIVYKTIRGIKDYRLGMEEELKRVLYEEIEKYVQ